MAFGGEIFIYVSPALRRLRQQLEGRDTLLPATLRGKPCRAGGGGEEAMIGTTAPSPAPKLRLGLLPPLKPRHFLPFGRLHGKSRAGMTLKVSSEHCCFQLSGVTYRPPGTEHNLLKEVTFSLPERSFGLIFGQSGSGKTTLLQLLAGLSQPTSGSISIQRYGNDGKPIQPPEILSPERVGIVFQFPERYFLADTVLEEITFGWPRQRADLALREDLAMRLETAINSVGLSRISLDDDPHALSGGFKRRLALALQLVQTPDLLLLDEPLAGLDWKARADIIKLLKHLKNKVTILVVSHDLKELSGLVDISWRMEMGGVLKEEPLPNRIR